VFTFDSTPDTVLIKLAQDNWADLDLLCWAYSLDYQLSLEYRLNPPKLN